MSADLLLRPSPTPGFTPGGAQGRAPLRLWKPYLTSSLDRTALTLAVASVPISIALAETFLAVAVLARIWNLRGGEVRLLLPRCFWAWLLWAGAETLIWLASPQPRLGWSEIRHLFLVAALFLVMPTLGRAEDNLAAWKGIFLTSTLSSLFLIGDFLSRLIYYHREIRAGGDVGLYLRSGGLLNHWMVYGTVEVVVLAGLLSYLAAYPAERRRWWPVAAIQAVAVLVSLTRMLWATSLLLLGITLVWRRSKWVWALPLLPIALYAVSPPVVRTRVRQSFGHDYYSNVERMEMLRVGWEMVRTHPLRGVGPGRVNQLYLGYLSRHDPVPAWHGHFHNNLVQIAAEFGIPATLAALLFVAVLFYDLVAKRRDARTVEAGFRAQAALLALVGYLFAGLFEYTYGHSLGLILLGFAVLPALIP